MIHVAGTGKAVKSSTVCAGSTLGIHLADRKPTEETYGFSDRGNEVSRASSMKALQALFTNNQHKSDREPVWRL